MRPRRLSSPSFRQRSVVASTAGVRRGRSGLHQEDRIGDDQGARLLAERRGRNGQCRAARSSGSCQRRPTPGRASPTLYKGGRSIDASRDHAGARRSRLTPTIRARRAPSRTDAFEFSRRRAGHLLRDGADRLQRQEASRSGFRLASTVTCPAHRVRRWRNVRDASPLRARSRIP